MYSIFKQTNKTNKLEIKQYKSNQILSDSKTMLQKGREPASKTKGYFNVMTKFLFWMVKHLRLTKSSFPFLYLYFFFSFFIFIFIFKAKLGFISSWQDISFSFFQPYNDINNTDDVISNKWQPWEDPFEEISRGLVVHQ